MGVPDQRYHLVIPLHGVGQMVVVGEREGVGARYFPSYCTEREILNLSVYLNVFWGFI